jgi:cell wall-associated NlpC family hydrolase
MNAPSFVASTNPAIMRHGLLAFLISVPCSFPCSAWTDGASTDRDKPLIHALNALGVQYRYGGRSPETGFDCSGLITHVFERAWGMRLPPGTQALSKVGAPVKKLKELEPGDLVFYNTRNRPFSHVGIYLGDGRFLHAPRRGARVRVESVRTPYWHSRFNGGRRLDPPTF